MVRTSFELLKSLKKLFSIIDEFQGYEINKLYMLNHYPNYYLLITSLSVNPVIRNITM